MERLAICFCFKNNKTLKLPVLKIQTGVLAISGSNLLLKFHNNFTAKFLDFPSNDFSKISQAYLSYQ